MDAFKLLSRSTSLHKRRNVSPVRPLPSAGAPSHSQMLANIDLQARREQDPGRKRKASEMLEMKTDTPNPNNDRRRSESNGSKKALCLDFDQKASPSTREDRARILRSHKIKVQAASLDSSVRGDGELESNKTQSCKIKFTPIYPEPLQSFSELHSLYRVSKRLQQNILDQGFSSPTEIQLATLPLLLKGRESNFLEEGSDESPANIDIFAVSPTGSGKTLAFMTSILDSVLSRRAEVHSADKQSHLSAVILAPTHELVHQIVNEGKRLTRGIGIRIVAMRRGLDLYQEDNDGKRDRDTPNPVKCEVIVSTPAPLSNILQESETMSRRLSCVSSIVLDEADILLDSPFRDDVMKIWRACSSPDLQSSLWSATMASSIETLALTYLSQRHKPHQDRASVSRRVVRVIAGLKDSSLPNITHRLIYTASEQGKLLALRQILHPSNADVSSGLTIRPPFLVFTQTVSRAVALHSELIYDIPAEAGGPSRIAVLHADLSLQVRSDTMARFRRGEVWVLVTTDVLSRGIDFRGINGVINFDMPTTSALYVHRAGRTGRAGREGGICCTLYTKEDVPYVKHVANTIAAVEKIAGKRPDDDDNATPRWLLDALPNLNKAARSGLKKRGVMERNGRTGRMRISTKSGYDRRLENRRRRSTESRAKTGSQDKMNDDTGGSVNILTRNEGGELSVLEDRKT